MSKPILYFHLWSSPARATYFLAKFIGLDFEEREVKLFDGETFTEEYRKLNPTGTVPVLVDGDDVIFDSHAIMIYLVEKYAENDDLYPKTDLKVRTKINQILFYEASYLFPRSFDIPHSIMVLGATDILQLTKDRIEKGFICFEKFLTDNEYVAGDRVTLADFSVWSLLEAITKHMGVTAEQYPKIFGYMEKLREELPFKNLVLKDISDFGQVLHLYRKE